MRSDGLDFTPRRFSTTTLVERDRVPFWRDVFGRQVVHLDIQARPKDSFKAEVVIRALPEVRSTSFVSSAARLERPLRAVADGDDALVLLVSQRGTLTAAQRGRQVSLRPGEATLLLHAEPSTVTHAQIRFQGLIVPRASVAALAINIDDAAMRVIPRADAALRLLMRYLEAIGKDLAIGRPDVRNLATTHIHDLMAIVIGASRDRAALIAERGVAAARLATIKGDIIEQIGRDDLNLIEVAARHGITPRSLQRLFERDGTTFEAFKLEQRLARARCMLRDRRYATWTVGAIAYSAGFGDLSYFHRVFRLRFGATPADIRAGSA